MLRSLILILALIFLSTLAAGVFTPKEKQEIEQAILTVLGETEEEEDIAPPLKPAEEPDTPPPTLSSASGDVYPVMRVIDGDTIVVNKNGTEETVRLIGVDTPETVHPTEPVQCFGLEASKKTKEWLEGHSVRLTSDESQGERDKYRRLLAYVWRDDGLFINLELIRQGYAYEYTYAEPYSYRGDFRAAEAEARAAQNGLWSPGRCAAES